MPKIKNKYTGKILEVSHEQLEILKSTNFPMEIIENSKPKKPEVLIDTEKKIKEILNTEFKNSEE